MTKTYTKEEQAANRQQWVTALRSGEYRQVKGALRGYSNEESVGFCCLGVACDLAERAGIVEHLGGGGYSATDDEDDYSVSALPGAVARWLGLQDDVGHLGETVKGTGREWDNANTLVGLNDDLGFTFEQIADVIEAGKVVLQ